MTRALPVILVAVLVMPACYGLLPDRPLNVLLVLADDLNDWVGALDEHPNALTPRIDRLASQGVLFREAYAASPKCNPSRTALLLGLRPSTTGIYDNGHWWRPHLPNAVTLPEAFRRAGYTVAGGGKVFHHTAGFNPPDLWDEYFRLQFDDPWDRIGNAYPEIEAAAFPAGHPFAGITPFSHELDWGALAIPSSDFGDAKTASWASRFLQRDHVRPFLLVVGLFHPHLPWYAPAEFFEAFTAAEAVLPDVPEDDLNDIPHEGRRLANRGGEAFQRIRDSGKWSEAVAAYVANVAFTDRLVGQVIDALDASPHASNTVVIFASDHGFHLGEKRHWYKSTLWERATHVPLVIRSPGFQPGLICNRPVSLLDIYPTLLDLAGLGGQPELEGSSLRPLLENPESQPERHALITYLRGNDAVRQGPWLYIRYRDDGEELYDREADPGEFRNLAARPDLQAVKLRLRGLLPKGSVRPAPTKSEYEFDPLTYAWTARR